MQQWYEQEFGPTGTANGGDYADKSYWVCTEYGWETIYAAPTYTGQNYPVDEGVYSQSGGFGNGYVPLFIVVGYQNKVYYDDNPNDFRAALRLAIDEMRPVSGVWVTNRIPDKEYQLGASQEVIDLSSIFDSIEGAYPISKTVLSNSGPGICDATIVGDQLTLTPGAQVPGTITIQIQGEDTNNATAVDEFTVYVYNPTDGEIEDFEDGNFTGTFTWTTTNSGASNWSVSTTSPQEGTYCAQSGTTGDDAWCAIETTVNYSAAGKISFWKKVSSEAGWDFLKFYIDGNPIGEWSGETAWSQSSYLVEEGNHTFKFEYAKDANTLGGSDQAWVDYIEFYNKATATIFPDINLSTASISTTAAPEGSDIDSFIMENLGEWELYYDMSIAYDGFLIDIPDVTYHDEQFTSSLGSYTEGGANEWQASGGFADTAHDRNIETSTLTSPVIDTSGGSNVSLSFDYVCDQQRSGYNFIAEYFDGSSWVQLVNETAAVTAGSYNGLITVSALTQVRFTSTGSTQGTAVDNTTVDNVLLYSPLNQVPYTWLNITTPLTGTVAISENTTVNLTCDATGLAEGVYTADVNIDSNDPDEDPKVLPVTFTVTTGGGGAPAVPANVVTSISGTDLVVDWDVSADATSYDVYSSDDPYGTFTFVTNVATNQYTVATDQAKLFYYIVAKN